MAINWDLLNERTAGYRSLIAFKSSKQQTVDLKFAGLRVRLSELEQQLAPDAFFLGIWADTLIIDTTVFNAKAIAVFARRVELAGDAAAGVALRASQDENPAVGQFFIGSIAGDKPLTVLNPFTDSETSFVRVGAGGAAIRTLVLAADGKLTTTADTSDGGFRDTINRPLALNALKASYMAATELINDGVAGQLETAQEMLKWVVSTIGLLGTAGNSIPGDYAELYCQAAATLSTISAKAGAYYVPVLSGEYYAGQTNKLVDALGSYETDFHALTTATDIKGAVGTIAANLETISRLQREPLQVDMDNIVQNAVNLGKSIQELRGKWELKEIESRGRQTNLYATIRDANLNRYFQAFIDTVINLGQTVYGVTKIVQGSPDAKIGDTLKKGWETIKSVQAMYKSHTATVKEDPLVRAANTLVNAQRSLADSFIAASGIWSEMKNGAPITQWPQPATADVFDPALAWDLYMIEVERVLTNLENSSNIGDDKFSGAPQEAATDYYASLRVLAQYGKAISSKMVAYSQLLSTAIKLRAELNANKKVQENWDQLKLRSDSDQEKVAALQGVLKSRMDAIRRSLFVAWTNYRNSYLYLYLEMPPADTRITTDMTARQLKEAVSKIGIWVGNLLAPASSKDRIVLPNADIKVPLKFPVIRDGHTAGANETAAYLTPAANGAPATITINIPRSITQFQGVLPNKGEYPIWVQSAQFFVKGAVANDAGNVMLNVSTSGTYQNGFPPDHMFRFENQGVEASFAYNGGDLTPYIKWNIDPLVYMMPSPFTLWTITFDEDGGDASAATELNVIFNVSFRSKKPSA